MKFYLISLGCPKNLTDSENFSARLIARGAQMVFSPEQADTVIINTCGFLASALKEAAGEIKKAAALKKKGIIKRVAVTGCMPERLGQEMKKYLGADGADVIFSISAQEEIEKFISKKGLHLRPLSARLNIPEYKMTLTAPHSAYLKIADGCDNRCAYCAIPMIRGPFRSKPIEETVREARLMVKNGAKEISLIAQDTTLYGMDLYGEARLAELLKKLDKIKGLEWIRIMYAYPHRVTAEIADIMAASEKIVKYLDMPVQHISDGMLKAMNRHYSKRDVLNTVEMLRKKMPSVAIRTNFIAGFPGETEKDFKELLSFVKDYEIDNAVFFEFEREKGTPAYALKNQISKSVKKERAEILRGAQSRVTDKKNKLILGKTVSVISDTEHSGRTFADAPDVDGRVMFTKPVRAGKIFNARVARAEGLIKTVEDL